MAQPLALDSVPAGQGAGWRKGQDLIDALPYVDRLTPEEKQRVDRLIQEEVGALGVTAERTACIAVLPSACNCRQAIASYVLFLTPRLCVHDRCGTARSGRRRI